MLKQRNILLTTTFSYIQSTQSIKQLKLVWVNVPTQFLQSAFFKLANVMPIDDAVEFMKAAAKKSYGKKGDAVVEMNYKAIDAGVDAVHKVEVPASWSNPEADAQLRRN